MNLLLTSNAGGWDEGAGAGDHAAATVSECAGRDGALKCRSAAWKAVWRWRFPPHSTDRPLFLLATIPPGWNRARQMKQSKKQPDVTRRAILEAAGAEFARGGHAGSGLGAIVARAGLTKGALFHHFPDKRSLVLGWIDDELLPRLHERWLAELDGVSSLDELRSWCRERIPVLDPGDPMTVMVAMAAETSASDPVLAGAFGRCFETFRDSVARAVERGKSDGWIHPSIRPASEAAMLLAMLAGFSVTFRCGDSDAVRRQAEGAVEAYLETLRKV